MCCHSPAKSHKGRIFLDLERYEEALGVYERAIEVAPNNTWAWHDKGEALYQLEQDEEALKAFNKALEINPNNEWAWHHKAVTLERLAQQAHEKARQFGYKEKVEQKQLDNMAISAPSERTIQKKMVNESGSKKITLAEFIKITRDRYGLTPRDVIDKLNRPNLNNLDYNQLLEQLEQLMK